MLDDIVKRGSPVTANRTLGVIRGVFRWGESEDIVGASSVRGIKRRIIEKPRDRVLSPDEIQAFWNTLPKTGMSECIRDILRLCLITGQRVSEITGMQVSELDLTSQLWELPASRTKNKRPHLIPLPQMAIDIIERSQADGLFVFATGSADKPITSRAPMRAIARNNKYFRDSDNFNGNSFQVHDLRRTVATQMAELGIERLTISKVLNHSGADTATITGAVYDRHSYMPEKRNALDRWTRRLTEIIEGKEPEKVVSLRS